MRRILLALAFLIQTTSGGAVGQEVAVFGRGGASVAFLEDDARIIAGSNLDLLVCDPREQPATIVVGRVHERSTISDVARSRHPRRALSVTLDTASRQDGDGQSKRVVLQSVATWDIETGEMRGRIALLGNRCLDISNDGMYIIIRNDYGILRPGSDEDRTREPHDRTSAAVYQLPRGDKTMLLSGHEGEIHAATIAFDNSLVATATTTKVFLWSLRDRKKLFVLETKRNQIDRVALSPDGKYLFLSGAEYRGLTGNTLRNWTIEQWDLQKRERVRDIVVDHPIDWLKFNDFQVSPR